MKTYRLKINGNNYNVDINSVEGNIASVTVNGTSYQVEMEDTVAANTPQPVMPTQAAPVPKAEPKTEVKVNAGAGKPVKSPLPGVIISVNVAVGDSVKTGQVVAVLEAMKMENEIQAEHDGTVTAVHVNKGDSVLEGAAIVTLA